MKKKIILFFLLFPLICFIVFIAYCYVSAIIERNKKYYLPQIETYLRVYNPPFNKYGYVIFSKDSLLPLSESVDYVKVFKSETSQISFIFNSSENNKIYIVDRWNNTEINQADFIIEKIDRTDTTFFEQESIAGMNTHILKPLYFEIFVEGFLQSVFFIDYDISECPIKAEPIK